MSLWRTLAAAALAAMLAACGMGTTISNTYDRWFGAAPKVKPAPLPPLNATANAKIAWKGAVGPAERTIFFPAVTGNVVYAAGESGQIVGFEAKNGHPLHRITPGAKLSGGVAASGSLVLAGTTKGEVVAFDASGKQLWKVQLAGEVLAPPAVEGTLVAVRAGDGRIYGLDAVTGKQRWVYQRTTPALSLRSYSGVVLERGAIFAGFPGGRLVALNAQNGAVGWDSVVALPRGTTELERVADVMGLPVVDGDRVCAVAYQGRVACFDTQSGTTIWARDMSSYAGMDADHRGAYITDEKNAVIALDKANGGSLWKQDKLAGRFVTAPLAFGRYVIVGDFEGYVHLLSREDGSFVGRVATDGSAIGAAPVALDADTVLVQTKNGGVFAITVQ
ncbi:MAG TPA: outer membrane protein assembly factor BamB [Burkholderiales bacterium]|nr:outer membrane protein assembly factor BamB [Burkholderiales bacterium]